VADEKAPIELITLSHNTGIRDTVAVNPLPGKAEARHAATRAGIAQDGGAARLVVARDA
jgi:hypothetical protein